jgi:hypothetical protein
VEHRCRSESKKQELLEEEEGLSRRDEVPGKEILELATSQEDNHD